MPAISTTEANRTEKTAPTRKVKVVAKKKKPKVKVVVTVPDAHEETRTREPRQTGKVRMYAHPTRPAAQKVFKKQADDDAAAARKRAQVRSQVSRIKVTPVPSPDARDSTRSAEQRRKDAVAANTNAYEAKERADKNKRLAKVGGHVDRYGKVKIVDVEASKAAAHKQAAESFAPVLKVLDQTTRINHAIAGGADAAVTGKDISSGVTRGIQNKDKKTFSDVLGHAGVKNEKVKSIGGFALDVATDPTTYATFGLKSAAAKSAAQAEKQATKKAVSKGLTDEQAKKFGERAAKKAEKEGDQTKGVAVKFAGKELPGVRKATAKASKPVRAAARKVTPTKVRAHARAVAADLNPDVVPAGVAKETSAKAVQATRTARSKINRGVHEADRSAAGIRARVGEENYSRIIDAIEHRTISKLPAELREAAIQLRSGFRHAYRLKKQAGIKTGQVTHRGQVKVPEVTADTSATAKDLEKARRAEARAEADLGRAHSERDVHQGRAEVLSRNVSGSRAEKAAERGRSTKRKVRPSAAPPPPEAQFIHVVRDTGTSASSKMERIREHGLKPTAGVERVYAWGPGHVDRADEFGKNGGATQIVIDGRGLEAHGGEGAAQRTFAGRVPPERLWIRHPDGTLTPLKARGAATVRYAGGGHGVQQTTTAAKDAAQRLKNARAQREKAETKHAKEVADAKVQRAERDLAEATNAKRAAAPKEYVPHNLTDETLEAEGKTSGGGVGRKVIRPTSSRERGDNRPLSVIRQESPGKYSEDIPTLYANHKAEGATAVARAELNRRIADLGKTVRKGKDITLEAGESVYHIVGSDITKVTDKKQLARLAEKGSHMGPAKGRYVVLHDDIVKRAIEGSQPTLQGPGIVRGLDKLQAGFKTVALATPGFHLRNFVGDSQNAYLGQPAYRLPGNMKDAGRVLKAEGRRDKALKAGEQVAYGKGTVNTGRYGEVSYEEIADHLAKHGGMRSGYTARELPELTGTNGVNLQRVRVPRKIKQAALNREDLPRLTTAINALKKGATWEEAAQRVADYHFDYAHLTSFERNIARRAAPFYTFTARNIPRQFKSLASHPGKFANYQKLIESAANAAGMDEEVQKYRVQMDRLRKAGVKIPDDWQALMTEWEQRNAGIPISWRGQKFTVSFGLPILGLNAVPGAAGKQQADEYFKTAMSLVTPIVKNPVEYFNNYSFFFRDQIERDQTPLVSAPSYVRSLPKKVRDDLGVARGLDKRTGKVIWRWPGKVDYIVKTVPGLPQYAQQLATEGTNRRGKGTGGKVLQLFGVRAEPFDPNRTLTNLAYERQAEINKRQAALRQTVNPANGRPVSAKNPTPEYTRLQRQLKFAQIASFQGSRAQGYKVLPKTGAPPKVRGGSGVDKYGLPTGGGVPSLPKIKLP